MKATLISAADEGFFDFLWSLVQSIRAVPESGSIDLSILDLGMTPQQLALLAPRVTRIVPAQWDLDFPARSKAPSWYKAIVSRPHLPRYFPQHELLIWIDADAWLGNWDAVQLLLRGGQTYGLAIVAELDRAYRHCYQLRPEVTANLRDTYLRAFGPEAAEKYSLLPVINVGVFAMRRDVPYWQIWSEGLSQALQRAATFLVEQCALNIAVYTGRIPAHLLPSWCNWNCSAALPILDPSTRQLHAPMLPHERISICHLVDLKRGEADVACTDGTTRTMPLTYQAVHARNLPPPRS